MLGDQFPTGFPPICLILSVIIISIFGYIFWVDLVVIPDVHLGKGYLVVADRFSWEACHKPKNTITLEEILYE